MKRTYGYVFLALLGCGSSTEGQTSASATSSGKAAAPVKSGAPTSSAATTAIATASAASSAAAAPAAADLAVLGGADWKAVFAGAPPMTIQTSLSGGQASGVADDHTRKNASASGIEGFKGNQAGGGDIAWSPSKKVVVIANYNIKLDPNEKTVDTWIKSALVKDVKHTAAPELVEVGEKKGLARAGAGTATLKEGDAADFYWYDTHCVGDFSHTLTIVLVSKTAPDDEKKAALSVLRTFENLEKCKPHYKK